MIGDSFTMKIIRPRRIIRPSLLTGVGLMLAVGATSGCVNYNDIAMELGAPPEGAVELRAKQTRRFHTLDEASLLAAATQSLLDLGYTINESQAEVGLLTGSKSRDAEEAGQVAGAIMITLLAAALGSGHSPTWDKTQTIRVTLVSTPIENSKQIEVRATFDRRLINNHGHAWRTEAIEDPEIYRQFFEKFATSAFLEAHRI